jgi:hypothetical protein
MQNHTTSSFNGRDSGGDIRNAGEGIEANIDGSDPQVEVLKAEIKVLTSALSVLEIQFEGAEREDKKRRTVTATPVDNIFMPKAAITLTEMVCTYIYSYTIILIAISAASIIIIILMIFMTFSS